MKISSALNLEFSLDGENGAVHFHSAPIRKEVFDDYALLLGRTIQSLYGSNAAMLAPSLALVQLKNLAKEGGIDVKPFLTEIQRLTKVIRAQDGEYKDLPFETALSRGLIDEDEGDAALSYLVFFTFERLMRFGMLASVHAPTMAEHGLRKSSSSLTEYIASLPTLTAPENTGETAITV